MFGLQLEDVLDTNTTANAFLGLKLGGLWYRPLAFACLGTIASLPTNVTALEPFCCSLWRPAVTMVKEGGGIVLELRVRNNAALASQQCDYIFQPYLGHAHVIDSMRCDQHQSRGAITANFGDMKSHERPGSTGVVVNRIIQDELIEVLLGLDLPPGSR
ncbi:hypothetical protein AC579_9170 [Pseudocercospora musae]|uniref:Uncharacterized protein n=1 Tax=Pseudocercospora musae TaxID=113226 RepID=A0A139I7G2_9PEZI|nr:hypothetical protein AC579_9170 [Pseudocercospora musae]